MDAETVNTWAGEPNKLFFDLYRGGGIVAVKAKIQALQAWAEGQLSEDGDIEHFNNAYIVIESLELLIRMIESKRG